MNFHKLSIAYFRSFQQMQTLEFPRTSGFFFLTGSNQIEKSLGANGAGKSAVFDALTWVLYGKTARGQKASDIVNWDAGAGLTEGKVDLEANGRYYSIHRTHSPNSLTICRKNSQPKTVTQERLEEILNLSYSEFLATVLMGQFNRFFFDLSPAEKLQSFSDALRLGIWQTKAKAAKAQAEIAQERLDRLRQREAALGSEISVLKRQLKIQQIQIEKAKQSRNKELLTLKVQITDAQERHDQQQHANALIAESLTDCRKRKDDCEKSLRIACMDRDQLRTKSLLLDQEHLQATNDIRRAKEQIKIAQGAKCPLCFGPLKDQEKMIQRKTAEHEECIKLRKKAGQGYNKSLAQWEVANRQADEVVKQAEGLKAEVADLEAKMSLSSSTLSDCRSQLSLLLERRRILSLPQITESDQTESLTSGLATARRAYRITRRLVAHHARRLESGQFWQKEFKNVRLWLVDEALRQLELEIGNCLLSLGLAGWKVSFDIERVTQAGSVSKGFNVLIQSPFSPERVKWESWSGGETERLRIAGAIGFANLVRARRGLDLSLEIWDEPTHFMNEQGRKSLLAFFAERAEERQIWLIDHYSMAGGMFDGNYLIKKTPSGSIISAGSHFRYGSVG